MVDDNRDAAESLSEALESEGHEVRVAFDGASALALGQEYRPAVVFLDIGLPVMDGYELALHLRSHAMRTNHGDRVCAGLVGRVDRGNAARAEPLHLLRVVNQWPK